MEIFINDGPADITLDTEKTLGEVISGIEQWIYPSGSRMQKINVDGKLIPVDGLKEAFQVNIADIGKLDISICPWRELAAEALGDLSETCSLYANAAFDERRQISAAWGKSHAAHFLISDIPDIYKLTLLTLSGEGLSPSELNLLVEERLNEITDPQREIDNSGDKVKITAERMEELPLDMQMGKDKRAAETIQLFSQIGEKLFRIFFIHKSEGLLPQTLEIDERPAKTFVEEFNSALKELSAAYENKDTVLAGDIAEYELAPRLLKFYAALKTITKLPSNLRSEP